MNPEMKDILEAIHKDLQIICGMFACLISTKPPIDMTIEKYNEVDEMIDECKNLKTIMKELEHESSS